MRRVEEVLQRPNEVDQGTPDPGWTASGAIELRHASLRRSVRDNVAMLQDVPDEVVLRSLAATDADDFVRRLRHGLESQVSLGGDNFSAGQGQRLALARAVVRDAPILVLDEATCNLDSHTERKVMDSILERRRGKTTLLFGHHLSALDRSGRRQR